MDERHWNGTAGRIKATPRPWIVYASVVSALSGSCIARTCVLIKAEWLRTHTPHRSAISSFLRRICCHGNSLHCAAGIHLRRRRDGDGVCLCLSRRVPSQGTVIALELCNYTKTYPKKRVCFLLNGDLKIDFWWSISKKSICNYGDIFCICRFWTENSLLSHCPLEITTGLFSMNCNNNYSFIPQKNN